MKKIFFLLILIGIPSLSAFTQSLNRQVYSHEFGKCTTELLMNSYDKDPNAEAVVIYDIGQSSFVETNDRFEVLYERRIKIKILNKAGIKWGDFEIEYYHEDENYELVSKVDGNSYNMENGQLQVTHLDVKSMVEEKINNNWDVKRIQMPNLKEGTVVELKYRILSPYIFEFRSWDFQWDIPVIFSEYTTKMIPFYEYMYIAQGIKKFDKDTSYIDKGIEQSYAGIKFNTKVYDYQLYNIPAFRNEGFITSEDDYKIKLNLQLAARHDPNGAEIKIMTTWPEASKDLLKEEDFGSYYKSSKKKCSFFTDSLAKSTLTARQKAERIDCYVKSHYLWNEINRFTPTKSVKDFLRTKTGNSAEINLFLAGSLNAAGCEAYPVILSTRSHGKILTDYPFMYYFNYCAVALKLNNDYILLDGTDANCAFGQLPIRCLNEKGLLINEKDPRFLTFSTNSNSTMTDSFDIHLNASSDSLNIAFNGSATYYEALDLRDDLHSQEKSLKNKFILDPMELVDSIVYEHSTEDNLPFVVKFHGKEPIERILGKSLIRPFLYYPIQENPFKQSVRLYPIDFTYKKSKKFISVIHIPDSMHIVSLPSDLNENNIMTQIYYHIEKSDAHTLIVQGVYTLKNDKYEGKNYSYLKSFFKEVIQKFNEKIVLEPINGN